MTLYDDQDTDALADYILGEDGGEETGGRAMPAPTTGTEPVGATIGRPDVIGTAPGERIYLNRCKDCRQTFETPYVGGKYCPACKRKRISAGQKARHAREHGESSAAASAIGRPAKNDPAANDRQVKTGTKKNEKRTKTWQTARIRYKRLGTRLQRRKAKQIAKQVRRRRT